ncbi:FecR domain-containing protein [Dysgonomonas termitidis]|uniref:FecR domain-containing protein n=1 Tax=Dysgonomonas termitidis TaxID=1516126 RepID=A0ABV9KW40_9BACT
MDEQNFEGKEELFYRYCNGTATPEERQQVDGFIANHPSAAEELEIVAHAVSVEKNIRELQSYDTAEGFRQVFRTIKKRRKRAIIRHIISRAAAILFLPLLLSSAVFGYMAFQKLPSGTVYAEITAAPGSISRFELPDHSKVWLNAGSTLRYPNSFEGDIREVTLIGEGYFEVQSDKKHPFFVTTVSGTKIMAYGTHFNVNTENSKIQAILAEGSVSMFAADRMETKLRPGEQAVYDEITRKITVSRINLYEKLAWKDGKIVFRNARLSEVFHQLGRRYNVDIILHDKYNRSEVYSARVTFTDETIQQIFTYLEAAAPIKWKLSTPVQNTDSTLARQRIDVWLK